MPSGPSPSDSCFARLVAGDPRLETVTTPHTTEQHKLATPRSWRVPCIRLNTPAGIDLGMLREASSAQRREPAGSVSGALHRGRNQVQQHREEQLRLQLRLHPITVVDTHPLGYTLTHGFPTNAVTSAQQLIAQLNEEHIVVHNGCG